ncbi:MAG: DUF6338 family protein [Candidatus Eisenbacteria bacterium]
MPDANLDSVWLIVALLPGFFSVCVRDFFLPPRRVDAFGRVFEVVAFALANYVLAGTGLVLLVWARGGFRPVLPWPGPLMSPTWGLTAAMFLYLLGSTAFMLGLVSGWVCGTDLHYRAARWLRLTARTGRDDVWQDVFADVSGAWHLVHFADGRRLLGIARYFSDTGERPSIYLARAAWVGEDGGVVPVVGDGVLVAEAARIQCIEFISGGGS